MEEPDEIMGRYRSEILEAERTQDYKRAISIARTIYIDLEMTKITLRKYKERPGPIVVRI